MRRREAALSQHPYLNWFLLIPDLPVSCPSAPAFRFAPDAMLTFALTIPNTSWTITAPASLRSDAVTFARGILCAFPPEQRSPFTGISSAPLLREF